MPSRQTESTDRQKIKVSEVRNQAGEQQGSEAMGRRAMRAERQAERKAARGAEGRAERIRKQGEKRLVRDAESGAASGV